MDALALKLSMAVDRLLAKTRKEVATLRIKEGATLRAKLATIRIAELTEFRRTGKLRIKSFAALVRPTRAYFGGPPLAKLKRGAYITVLGLDGIWCRVRTEDGKLGWMPRWSLLDRFHDSLERKPRRVGGMGGHSRHEVVIGGRGPPGYHPGIGYSHAHAPCIRAHWLR